MERCGLKDAVEGGMWMSFDVKCGMKGTFVELMPVVEGGKKESFCGQMTAAQDAWG